MLTLIVVKVSFTETPFPIKTAPSEVILLFLKKKFLHIKKILFVKALQSDFKLSLKELVVPLLWFNINSPAFILIHTLNPALLKLGCLSKHPQMQ